MQNKQNNLIKKANKLPLSKCYIGEEEKQEVLDTLESGWLCQGKKVEIFENKCREYLSCQHLVALSSCTAALHLALLAAGVGPGDEVITSPVAFASSLNMILMVGAKPILVDVDETSGNIDLSKVEEKVSAKSKALLIIDLAGRPCDLDHALYIAKKHQLILIEDAAHSLGSSYKNQRIGSIADYTCFSFYATKNITCADGGLLCTKHEQSVENFYLSRNHGMDLTAYQRDGAAPLHWEIVSMGYKYAMTDLQASIGMHQIDRLEGFKEQRKVLFELYQNKLNAHTKIELPPAAAADSDPCWHLFIIQVAEDKRDAIALGLRDAGIGVGFHFPPLHQHPFYLEVLGQQNLPHAERLGARTLSLPFFPGMTEEDIDDVVHALQRVCV